MHVVNESRYISDYIFSGHNIVSFPRTAVRITNSRVYGESIILNKSNECASKNELYIWERQETEKDTYINEFEGSGILFCFNAKYIFNLTSIDMTCSTSCKPAD